MKVLVTGANGFLGSHLVERLLAAGDDPVALVRPGADLRWLAEARGQITVVEATLRDREALLRACSGVDAVCHVAGATRARPESRFDEVNVGGTEALLAACEGATPAPRRFVLCSSLAAGGPAAPGRPKSEADPDAPPSAYGRSKQRAEAVLFDRSRRVEAVALRPGPIYGPRDAYFLEVLKLASRGLFLRVGPKDALYNFCYVSDVAEAFLRACRAPEASGRALYIGDDTNYRAAEFEQLIAEAVGVGRRLVVPLPNPVVRGAAAIADALTPRRAGAPPLNRDKARELTAGSWGMDVSEAKRCLGWRPEVGFADGLARAVAWYRAEGWLPRGR